MPDACQVYDVICPLDLWAAASQLVYDPAKPEFTTLQLHVPTSLLNLVALVESGQLRLRDREVCPPAPEKRHLQLEA